MSPIFFRALRYALNNSTNSEIPNIKLSTTRPLDLPCSRIERGRDESGADDAGIRGNEKQDHRVEIAFELCVAANAARYRI